MSETQSEWVWQGFYGPKAAATAAKAIIDQDMRAGAWVPVQGQPPMLVDVGGTQAMFAVQTRRGNPIPTPAGLMQAVPNMVGRIVGG
jgi:hypothetical protein